MSYPSPNRATLLSLLERAITQGASRDVIEKLQCLLHYSEHGSVTKTCTEYSISRMTFYRWLKKFDPVDYAGLDDRRVQKSDVSGPSTYTPPELHRATEKQTYSPRSRMALLSLLELAITQGASRDVIEKLQCLLHYSEHGSVTKTCTEYSISRMTFYRWLKKFDPVDYAGLDDGRVVSKEQECEETNGLSFVAPAQEADADQCPCCSVWQALRPRLRRICMAIILLLSLAINAGLVAAFLLRPQNAYASSWSPTLLVNTEAFQTIDDSDTNADIELRFGDSVNETIYWDRTNSQFRLSDDVQVDGKVTMSGALVVEEGERVSFNGISYLFPYSDGTATGKVLKTDGNGNLAWSDDKNDGGASTVTLQDAYDNDTNGGDTHINLTSADDTLVFSNPASGGTNSGWVLVVDQNAKAGSGILIDSEAYTGALLALDNFMQGSQAYKAPHIMFGYQGGFDTNLYRQTGSRLRTDDDLWVGQTLSGAYLHAAELLTVSGAIVSEGNISTRGNLTLNADQTAADVTLTFGSDTVNETLTWFNDENRFEFSDALNVTGNLTTSGGLVVNSASRIKADLDIAGTLSGASITTADLLDSQAATSGSLLVSRTAGAEPEWKTPLSSMVWFIDGGLTVNATGSAIFTMPFGFTVSTGSLRVNVAPTGSAIIVDINRNGTSIFSTNPQINADATTSAKSGVLSATNLSVGDEISVAIDQVGSTTAGSGLTIMLNGTRKY